MAARVRFSESSLRLVWEETRFAGCVLQTADGRAIRVLYPGTPNTDGGPDFQRARIRIGGVLYEGDVELHLDASSWCSHRHQIDPHYNGVILHVALSAEPGLSPARTRSGRVVPLLVLPPEVFSLSPSPERGTAFPVCRVRGEVLPFPLLARRVHRLSLERLRRKTVRYEMRLRDLVGETQAGTKLPEAVCARRELRGRSIWDQLLYEAVMECLGYAKNRRPMLALARSLRLEFLRGCGLGCRSDMEASLLGAAGLLPSSRGLPLREARVYVRALRRRWKEVQAAYRAPVLHEAEWLFFRLRPANFPTARLAAMAGLLPLLFREGWEEMVRVIRNGTRQPRGCLCTLLGLFAFRAEGYWVSHTHFRAAAAGDGVALGRFRALDVLVNALVPLALLYGKITGDRILYRAALRLYASVPPLQENIVTAGMRRMLGDPPLHGAREQQGLQELRASWCTSGRCTECPLRR